MLRWSCMPEVRYIRYMGIGEIKQIMRHDLADGRLNPLQRRLFEARPAEFLYDIEQDPWETQNLVDKPEQQPLLDSMRQALEENILRYCEVLFLSEYEIGLISKSTTPYALRQDEQKYP